MSCPPAWRRPRDSAHQGQRAEPLREPQALAAGVASAALEDHLTVGCDQRAALGVGAKRQLPQGDVVATRSCLDVGRK